MSEQAEKHVPWSRRVRELARFRDDALRAEFGADLPHKALMDAVMRKQQDRRDAELRIQFGKGWEDANHDALIAEFMRRTAEAAGNAPVVDDDDDW